METKGKYKVKIGDPFGGYSTVGECLTITEAKELEIEMQSDCDYFTTVHIEDENGKQIYVTKEMKIIK